MRKEIIFTEEQLRDIKESYLNGESSVKIGERYGISHKPILKVLSRMGIDRDQKRFVRKYSLNENYFDIIDIPNKAYILGLLYADGSNCLSKGTISISLQEEDKELLEYIRKEIGSDKPLEYLDYSNKNDFGYKYKNQYRLIMFSAHMCNSLKELGMIPNKSLQLTMPILREDLYSHFIRGYFDGDGSFCSRYTPDGKYRCLTTITSTDIFCQQAKDIISRQAKISCGNIYDASCHNGITKVLSISGKIQNRNFYEWLYKDSTMYLDRKYYKVMNAFPNMNNSLIV